MRLERRRWACREIPRSHGDQPHHLMHSTDTFKELDSWWELQQFPFCHLWSSASGTRPQITQSGLFFIFLLDKLLKESPFWTKLCWEHPLLIAFTKCRATAKKAVSLHHQLLHPKQNCVPVTCFAILFLEIFYKKTLFLGIISPFFLFQEKTFLFYCIHLVKEPTNDSNTRSLTRSV